MVNFEIHRQAVESTFLHTCNIYAFAPTFDEETKETYSEEVIQAEAVRCKISQSISTSGTDKAESLDGFNKVTKNIKLFLPLGTEITAGGKVSVNYNGRTDEFITASEPVYFNTHIEIALKLEKVRA